MSEDRKPTPPIDPNRAIDFMVLNAGKFAQAKAQRVYLEHFRKSKKALLMGQSEEKTAIAREQFAYGHPEYVALLEGFREAIVIEETLRWDLVAAQARVEVWRSQESSNRMQDRTMR